MGYQLKEVYNSVDELETRDRAISVIYGRTPDAAGGQLVPVALDAGGNITIGSPLVLTTDDIDIGDVVIKGQSDANVNATNTSGENRVGLHRVGDTTSITPGSGNSAGSGDGNSAADDLWAMLTKDPRMTFTNNKLNVDTSVTVDKVDVGDVNITGKIQTATAGTSVSETGGSTTTAGTETFDINIDGAGTFSIGPLAVNTNGFAIAADMQTKIRAATGTLATVSFNALGPNQYTISSDTTGPTSSVVVTNTNPAFDLIFPPLLTETTGLNYGDEGTINAIASVNGRGYALEVQDPQMNFAGGALQVTSAGSGTIFTELNSGVAPTPTLTGAFQIMGVFDVQGFRDKSFVIVNTSAASDIEVFGEAEFGGNPTGNFSIPIAPTGTLLPGASRHIVLTEAMTHFRIQARRVGGPAPGTIRIEAYAQ